MTAWWRRPSSLSARLTLLVLALAVPMLIVIALSYSDALHDRRTVETNAATFAARNSASIVEGFLRDLESTTYATAGLLGSSSGALDQATYGPYLKNLTALYPELRAYFITDPNGKVVASDSGVGIGVDLSTRPYLPPLKAGAPKIWSGSITGLQSGDITVAFGRPITAPSGANRGYLITAFYPEKVIKVLKPDYPSDARLVLIDEKAHVLYDSGRNEPAAAEIDVSSSPGVTTALHGQVVPVDNVATPFAGEPQFGALVPISRTNWVLSVTRPVAGLDAELTGRLLSDTVAVLATLAIAAFIATLIASRLSRPLRELSQVASGIARGERPLIPAPTGGIEVEQLSAAMRTMQGAVAKREDELSLLATAGESLSSSLDYTDTLRRAARVAIPGFADWCVVDVLEGGMIARAAVATADPARDALAQQLRERFPPSQPANPKGPVPQAIASGRPVLMSDVTEEFLDRVARHPEERELYRALGPRSFISLPLPIGDRVVGAVTFITAESGRRFTGADLDLAKQLARRMALSIENARLYYEVQQSVRTRDDFLSAVAHELKTPLTVISASTQMLQRRERQAGEVAEPALTRILGSVARMTAFIEELLELVRRQADPSLALTRARVDLSELVRGVVVEASQFAHGQQVIVEADSPVVGDWDATRIERAVSNLVGNAIKYNRQDGTVIVRVGTDHTLAGSWAVVSVIDEGIGVPEADRARIFERFTRGANVAGRISGSGVGLAIVRQVVEQHGGTIELSSVEGRGSTFTMRLPLAGVPVAAAAN
ncbi:MAG: ATP-binding protein [Chloroflexota bacterium]|nr:ATP-binding protein [Chloroflexota bacterium]